MKEYDKKFLQQLQKHDAHAFGVIYDELVDQFYRYIKSNYSLDESTTQDLLSEIFMKIWQVLPKLDTSSSLSGFLWTIARNHIKDHFKRHDEIPFANFSSNSDSEEWSSQSREDNLKDDHNIIHHVHTWFTFEQIKHAMEWLETSYKEVIHLKYIEEYSYEEIAHTLWLSQDAIRQRISRWLKRINEMLSHLQ